MPALPSALSFGKHVPSIQERSCIYKSDLVDTDCGNTSILVLCWPSMAKQKNPNAVSLGRLGGKKGGRARWANVSAEERSRILSAAVKARWAKARKKKARN